VLPRRPGVRFALEALFLVLLALAAGLAHLRPLYIVIVMAAAWLLVALAELTAERIDRSTLVSLLPRSSREEEEGPQEIFGPPVEERTVVAPPEPKPKDEEEDREPEKPSAEELTIFVPAPPEEAPDAAEEPEPEPEPEPAAESTPEPKRRRLPRLRRREPQLEPASASPPRHVKLLPRRSAPQEPSRASKEVAELFGPKAADDELPEQPKETGT
jgi:hypothetical protein